MKITLIVLILFLFSECSSDLYSQPESVNGGFTNCRIYEYKCKNRNPILKTKSLYRTLKINKQGKIIEQHTFFPGKKTDKIIYTYNDKDQLVLETSFNNGKFFYEKKYTYDEKGLLSEVYDTYNHHIRDALDYYRTFYKYDESGNEILKTEHTRDNTIIKTTTKRLYKDNRLSEINVYENGKEKEKILIDYNQNGDTIQKVVKKKMYIETHLYQENKLIEINNMSKEYNNPCSKQLFTYINGKLKSKEHLFYNMVNGELSGDIINLFDKNGNIKSVYHKVYDFDNEPETLYEYEYY